MTMFTKKQLNQKIAGFKRTTATLRENGHEILVHAAGHAYAHGNVTAFTQIFDAMTGADRHAAARWIAEFGFAKLNKDGTFSLNKAMRNKGAFGDHNDEGGNAVVEYLMTEVDPWYAFAKPKSGVAADLDVEKQIQSLINRVKKARDEGERNVVVPFGTRKALAELADLTADIRDNRRESNAPHGEPGDGAKDVTPEPRMIAAE